MILKYCSDLHLEFFDNADFIRDNPIEPVGEVLILAGDVTNLDKVNRHREFFDYVGDNFEQVWWVPGNHEYYHNDLAGMTGTFHQSIRTNISLLNNMTIEYKGHRLVLSTLWSQVSLMNAWRVEKSLNDFYQITLNGKRFTVPDYNDLHKKCVLFLCDELAQDFSGKTVVVTHHVPTFQYYPPEYKSDFLNEAFATDLDELILKTKPDYWIYGHHHRNIPQFKIGQTTLITNQLGYVQRDEHYRFNQACHIEL